MLGLGTELMADAAIGGGVLYGLFGYNRGNYMYDAEFRFERFSASREMAIAQAEMYRGDLRALSALTMKKNTMYSIVASLCMALCVALYCAGRLGLHGPSPPAWIMGLWYTNNAASFSFMALAIWLATHAAFRAQSASVSLLTRKMRLPVPSLKQLDQARRFASEFEQQNWGDIFRVPYMTNNGAPKTDEAAQPRAGARARSAPAGKRGGRASSWVRDEFENDRAGTLRGGAPAQPADAAPEHFRQYLSVMKEWYAYDIYARVAIIYGLLSYVHALGYYGLGHINIELRAFWVPHAVGFVLMVTLALLLRFDIVRPQGKKELLPGCQWLGPIAWVPAAVGMSLEFRVEFNMTAVVVCWVCVLLSYVLQFIYTLRLIEVALPDDWRTAFRAEERIGATWWPESWRVPSHFQHVLYLVAPPTKLQPGQNDIYREVQEGRAAVAEEAGSCPPSSQPPQGNVFAQIQYVDSLFEWAFQDAVFGRVGAAGQARLRQVFDTYEQAKKKPQSASEDMEMARICRESVAGINAVVTEDGDMQPLSGGESGYETTGSARRDEEAPAGKGDKVSVFGATRHIQPWGLVVSVVAALAVGWVICICGTVIDIIVGEQGLITAPHWSRPPMTRLSLEPHEIGTPWGFPWPAGAKPFLPQQMAWHEEKRHAEKETLGDRRLQEVAVPQHGLASAVDELMAVLRNGGAKAAVPEPLTWPSFFEPKLLACGPEHAGGSLVAALTPRGFGASAFVGRGQPRASESFSLGGIGHLPPLMGASWGQQGLVLVSRAGHLMACPGAPEAGTWPCRPMAALSKLPVPEGAQLSAATAAYLPGPNGVPRLHAAFVDAAVPELAAIFAQEGEGEAAAWLPLGEMLVPDGAQAALSIAEEGELLLTTAAGALVRRRLVDGGLVASAKRGWGAKDFLPAEAWQGACGLRHGPVAHLHLRREAHARVPVVTAAAVDEGKDLFFQ